MKYKVGDKVRVRSGLQINRSYGAYTFVSEMSDYKGSVVAISEAYLTCYCIEEDKGIWKWTDEMFEGLAEDELTAEEAIILRSEMCANTSCCDCKLSGHNNGTGTSCNEFSKKYPERVIEILKQQKKEHEKKEVEVESKLYCRIIDGGDGSTVRSEALQDGINPNDEIKEILAKYCSEHVGDYFAVCENRWMVKQ